MNVLSVLGGKMQAVALGAALALALVQPAGAAAAVPASAAAKPGVTLSRSEAGTGGSVTVTGSGWRPGTLLMMLICGQSVPSRGVIGGTNSCANSDGRAVTTDAKGGFSRKLPVAEPPRPCPCVVHVATVTGEKAEADAVFMVAGHAVEPLPKQEGGGRIAVLTDTRLDGSSGLLTWFGSPPSRTLVLTVGNVGTAPVKNPVFQVGTAHGVFAPQWEEQEWRGTIAPGRKAQIRIPVELSAGAHGDYTISLRHDGKVIAEQPWGVGRPWGVTLFWILLCVVVPAALFRVGMAVVDRARPRRSTGRPGRHRGLRPAELTLRLPWAHPGPRPPEDPAASGVPALPWFIPGNDPGTGANRQLSAPHENGPTTQTRKGHT